MLKLAQGEADVIEFGAVGLGSAQKSVLFVASAAVNVTARVHGGEGRFRIASLACQAVSLQRLTDEEIAQLPAHMRDDPRFHVSVERTVVGVSDGTTPLAVGEAQELAVTVTFAGADAPGQGVQSATLILVGAGSPISVPLTAVVGEVRVAVPAGVVKVTQGDVATLSVTIASMLGDRTVVRFHMDPVGGLSMPPVAVALERGAQAPVPLRIEAQRFVPAIGLRADLQVSAFDGRQLTFVPLTFDIQPAPVPIETVTPSHLDPIKPGWWQWSGPNPRNATWKEDYPVAGTFTNKGGSDVRDLAITILEVEDAPGALFFGEANVGATEHAVVAREQSRPAATGALRKDWQWLIPAIWFVRGPTHRIFRYRALLSAKDVNDLPYPPVTFADLRVIVNVSKLKRTSGAYAMGCAAAAAELLALFQLIAAAAAYTAASIAGAVALDPPVPDADFRARIPLPPPHEPPSPGPDSKLVLSYRLGERIMRIELAKSQIEGRRLGALAAGDAEWVGNHDADLAAATALQHNLAEAVRTLAPQVRADLQALQPAGATTQAERQRLRAAGLTPELAQRMGLPDEHRAGFDALLRADLTLFDGIGQAVEAAEEALSEFDESLT